MEDSIVILVVEDDRLIQSLVEDTLTDGGYQVAMASSAAQAIELLDAQEPKYRALITDVNLGRDMATGWDIARHAREIAADLPVVYITSDSAAEWTAHGVPQSILIAKPFAPAQLLTAVSQLMNVSGASSLKAGV